MKNIIISGSPRAGKSTLAKKLNEELNYFNINVDKLVVAFQGAYPQLDIRLNWDRKKTAENLAPFIGHYLGLLTSNHGAGSSKISGKFIEGNRFVLEGVYLDFERIQPILNMYEIQEIKDNFMLIGLVQNNKTVDEFLTDFRKYDTKDDWTYKLSDDDLRGYVEEVAIPFNQSKSDYLSEWDFTIYDTSMERERILNQIVEDIKLRLVLN